MRPSPQSAERSVRSRAVIVRSTAPSPKTGARAGPTNALFVGSVAKCFQVLEAINSAGRPVALTELAELSSLGRSAVQRITHTLKTLRYIRQHPRTRAYTLSSRMLEFGHTVLATDGLREKAQPHLEALNRRTGETVNLMEMEGDEIVYIARFPSVHAVSVDLHVGSRLPTFCTAAGRAMLARYDPAEVQARLSTSRRRAMTPHTVTDLPGLTRRLAEARRLGYALNDQEAFIGDISVAVALEDQSGAVVGAINIAVPTPRWKLADVKRQLVPKVLAAARDITSALGVL
jgi:IclR family transcriptional regulator, pca regulon regulatory protein